MIRQLREDLVAAMDAQIGVGLLLEGWKSVQATDDLPIRAESHPVITVDLESFSEPSSDRSSGTAYAVRANFVVRGYVAMAPKSVPPTELLYRLYWSDDRSKGLYAFLRVLQRTPFTSGGQRILWTVGESRRVRQQERPEGRFTEGFEVNISAQTIVSN